MEIKQLALIRQELLAVSFSLVLSCQLWAGDVKPAQSKGCKVAEGGFSVNRQDSSDLT